MYKVSILSFEYEILFTRQFNSFVYKWLYTSDRFDSDALGNIMLL